MEAATNYFNLTHSMDYWDQFVHTSWPSRRKLSYLLALYTLNGVTLVSRQLYCFIAKVSGEGEMRCYGCINIYVSEVRSSFNIEQHYHTTASSSLLLA